MRKGLLSGHSLGSVECPALADSRIGSVANLPFTPTELHSMSWPKSLINRL